MHIQLITKQKCLVWQQAATTQILLTKIIQNYITLHKLRNALATAVWSSIFDMAFTNSLCQFIFWRFFYQTSQNI